MAIDFYENLLEELGELMGTKLSPDKNNTCALRLKNKLEIYFEMDKAGKHFIIGTVLGMIPPGKYRENLFKEAMKCNGLTPPLLGIFAFNKPADSLIFFRQFPADHLKGEHIFAVIPPFVKTAGIWKEAIDRGAVPETVLVQDESSKTRGSGIFGL